jgi:sensor histidine kinase YesM
MKKLRFKIEIWQILFVIVASAFAVVFLNSIAYGLTPETFLDSITHTFIIASSVCIGIFYFAPKVYDYSSVKRVAIITLVIFVATMIGLFLTKLFLGSFNNYGIENYYTPSRRTVIFSLVISYTFGLSTYFYLHSQNKLRRTKELLRQKELDEAKAKSLAVSAQLASLESKIHPHFLFNTLNSIAALIKDDPDKAEKMVEKLSALLRYSLDFKPNKLVSLAEEIKITKDYLEIESARFADKLVYNFDIQSNLKDEKLPAFALQTLVENSIKHVAAKRSTLTQINISAFNSDRSLKIEVRDNGFGFSESDIKSGHGLDTLRKRLENIFGNDANLEIIENVEGGKVRVEISV